MICLPVVAVSLLLPLWAKSDEDVFYGYSMRPANWRNKIFFCCFREQLSFNLRRELNEIT